MDITKNKLALCIKISGSLTKGVLLYFIDGFKEKYMIEKHGELWIGKSLQHWIDMTFLSYKAVANAVNDLGEQGLIDTKVCLHPNNGRKMKMVRVNQDGLNREIDKIKSEYNPELDKLKRQNGNGSKSLNSTNENINENISENNIYSGDKLIEKEPYKEDCNTKDNDRLKYNNLWKKHYIGSGLGNAEDLSIYEARQLQSLKGVHRSIEALKKQIELVFYNWDNFLMFMIEETAWKNSPTKPNPKFLCMVRQQFWNYEVKKPFDAIEFGKKFTKV